MTLSICETCGTQYPDTPTHCAVCEDERQYVGSGGQLWTTHEALKATRTLRMQDEAGVLGIGLAPDFAINQRALYLPTDAGNILWECLSVVTDEVVADLTARGGIDLIAISHPHFYAAMLEWSEAFGNVPILLHEADRAWVRRPSPNVRFWRGDSHRLSDAVTLIRTGGHFPGSTVLHWKDGPRAGGALFSGDAPHVVSDRRHVSFMHSYPNFMPMPPTAVRGMQERLAGYDFEDVYGFTWGRNIIGAGRSAVDASFERYLSAIAD
ncbi:MBL fold metallo-hydrolase [Rhodanobacter ginsengiterrae]|uniref:MBL fold metallo-hydrolase n=1 Tax=Rhodanobacter ginsengiterrae TaxID=2008451 RepID=UPI003CFA1548